MANEATLVVRTEHPINFTVANATGIEKGTLLKMTDPMTASASDGANDILAGIAASEKIASDGVTSLGVYRKGIFKMKVSGAVALGQAVTSKGSSSNEVQALVGSLSGARVLGTCLETAATGDTALIAVNIQATGVA